MTETEWDLDYVAHGAAGCTSSFLTVNIQGEYSLEGESDAAEGAREAVFGFSTKTVTGHMEQALEVINGACGVTDTAVDVALDISGGCAGLGAYPIAECAADYDIVFLSGNTLQFGARPADNNMCSADKRPDSFFGGIEVNKQ